MTENRTPREHEFRGWRLGPFFGGRLREVTEEDREWRRRNTRRSYISAALLLAYVWHPVLGIALTVAVVVIALNNWRNR